jgi:ssDNA-binding Zn-finger/Zn-ribbon topoisomerase 1
MEFLIVGLLIFFLVSAYSKSNGQNSKYLTRTPVSPPQVVTDRVRNRTMQDSPNNKNAPPVSFNDSSDTSLFRRSNEGYLPDDCCNKCGKEWIKLENSHNGGRFFTCSGWPRCDNTREKQIREKFCVNGHRRTSSNTAYTSDGRRRCLVCRPYPETSTTSQPIPRIVKTGSPPTEKNRKNSIDLGTHCRNGHFRTPENTYTRPDGERECRICRRNARK